MDESVSPASASTMMEEPAAAPVDSRRSGLPRMDHADPTDQPARYRRKGNRLLPAHLTDAESLWKRRLFEVVALAVTISYLFLVLSYWAPAHPGVDQNGYLVGGKQLALTGSTGFKPSNPFQYVGAMWVLSGDVETGDVWYYPKYPIGLPLLNALPLWIDWEQGKAWALLASPVSAALSVLGMFLLVRTLAGSFVGILGMLVLGLNYMTLILANNPNSHAPALAFVVWGMFLFIRWWQTGSIWRGLLAGFLLGFAVTIRYTEGLLLAPIALAVLTMIRYRGIVETSWWRILACALIIAGATWLRLKLDNRLLYLWAALAFLAALAAVLPWGRWPRIHRSAEFWRAVAAAGIAAGFIALCVPAHLHDRYDRNALIIAGLTGLGMLLLLYVPRDWRRAAMPLVGWSIPVLWLVGFNWFAMGSITGYDTTNESSGFTWDELARKWEYTVQQLYDYGAFFLLPLAIVGFAAMWRMSWRLGLSMLLWLVPGCLLYAAYYWGMDLPGTSYLRFFLTLLPPIVLAAMVTLRHGGWAASNAHATRRGAIVMPVGCGVLAAIPCVVALRNTLPMMQREQAVSLNLYYTSELIASHVPAGSVLFCDTGRGAAGLANFIQWRGDYELYTSDAFAVAARRTRAAAVGDRPHPRQAARNEYLRNHVYQNLSEGQLNAEQSRIVAEALRENRRVFAIAPVSLVNALRRRPGLEPFAVTRVQQWNEPVPATGQQPLTPLMPRQARNGESLPNRTPQSWQILEITSRPSAPATRPATQRAAPTRRTPRARTTPTTNP